MAGMVSRQCGMRNAECGMRNAECGVWNVECGIERRGRSHTDPPLAFRIPHSAFETTARSRSPTVASNPGAAAHTRVTDEIPCVVAQLRKQTGAVSNDDRVGGRGDRHRRDRSGFVARHNSTPACCLRATHALDTLTRMTVQAIAWSPTGAVRIVDQRALPEARIERDLESGEAVADAIRTLQVRGAPLIGIAAAMGLVAGTRELRAAPREGFLARMQELAALLGAARPTAVNLRWALDRMVRAATATPGGGAAVWERLQAEATDIWEEDRAMCRRIGEAGLPLVPDGAKVLTHCNAGALATGGIGTALAPIYLAHDAGRRVEVFVDETRPVLQGA